jgi:hypothetical protein
MKTRLFAFLLLLSACTCNREKQEGSTTDSLASTQITTSYSERLASFTAYITQLDSTIVNNSLLATQRYQALFKLADSTHADSAFVLFTNFHKKTNDYLNAELVKDTINYARYVNDTVIEKNPKAKDFLNNMQRNGFTLAIEDGTAYVKVDYDFYLQQFAPYVSGTMKSYLQQSDKEEKEGYMSDGGLTISPSSLADRIVFWENFLQQHPGFSFGALIQSKLVEYTTFLLEGVDNTPLFRYNSKELNPAYQTAFEHIENRYSNSKLASLVKPYFIALQQRDSKKQQQLLSAYRKQGLILDFSE